MEKVDHKKQMKEFYKPSRTPVIVDVPPMQFLMIDGQGYPGTSVEYQQAMEALYPMAYTLKFSLKKAGIIDFTVMPLEGLWWAEDMEVFSIDSRKEEWLWTSMIMVPPEVTDQSLKQCTNSPSTKEMNSEENITKFTSVIHVEPPQKNYVP
jgi:hypothetical protein